MSSLFRKSTKRKRGGTKAAISSESNKSYELIKPPNESNSDIESSSSSTSPPSNSSIGRPRTKCSMITTFADLNLCPPLVETCRKLGFQRPTAVQRAIIPLILDPPAHPRSIKRRRPEPNEVRTRQSPAAHHILTLSATGSGKTAAFALPLLHLLSVDPYGIFALILTPTRELAKQIQQQILALGGGSGWKVTCALVIGGEDMTKQSLELNRQPNFCVATPGRLAELCRDGDGGGLYRPNFKKVRFVVLDEADRLLSARSGFERDVAEILLQSTTAVSNAGSGGHGERRVRRNVCRTLLFSATMTRSLKNLEEIAGAGAGRLPLMKVIVREDGTWDSGEVRGGATKKNGNKNNSSVGKIDEKASEDKISDQAEDDASESEHSGDEDEGTTPYIPAGLRQEYIFMPSRVREAYLLCAIRTLVTRGGRGISKKQISDGNSHGSGWNATTGREIEISDILGDRNKEEEKDSNSKYPLAQSVIIFVPTCERAAHISGILTELGIQNVALHSLLSQNRRLASLGMFQSQRVRVLVATDVASRGLDVPEVDLVLNAELPRRAVDYVHRVGRTARAGRRGRAVSLVGEHDIDLVHEAERISGRKLEKCSEVTDEMAVRLLGPVTKASRLAKMKLMDIGFDELVKKHRERKKRDKRMREKAEKRARKAMAKLREK